MTVRETLKAIGPAIIVAAVVLGPGSILASSKVGAEWGWLGLPVLAFAVVLMIGMVAFIVDVPQSPTDPATVLPVQVYLWADSPERAFVERTSAAIIVLIGFLVCMNLTAQILRQKFEKHW